MSYKQEFQSNNADLQGLIDLANSLPEAENLDTELVTQDDLIAQIAAALEGKTGASDNEDTSNVIFAGYVTATNNAYLYHESFKTCTNCVLTLSVDRVTNTSLNASNLIVSYVFGTFYDSEFGEYYPTYKITYGGTTCSYPTNVHTEGMFNVDEGFIYSSRNAFNTATNAYYLVAWNAPVSSLITFTIDGTSYQAEEGMTWLEWVESDYNTGGFTCYGDNYEVHATLTSIVKSVNINSGLLLGSSIIEPNGKYKIMTGGGDN